MALDPQRHRLDALQQQEGAERRQHGAGRALVHAAAARDVGACSEMLGVDEPVVRGIGLVEHGKASGIRFHGKRPLSTMMPPIVVPWPPMNLVSECTTISAPYSIGLSRIGVATVLSTIRRNAGACANGASASMSQMLPAGLPTLSQNTALVFSSMSRSMASGASDSAKRTLHALARQHMREQRVRGPVELRHRDDVAAEFA